MAAGSSVKFTRNFLRCSSSLTRIQRNLKRFRRITTVSGDELVNSGQEKVPSVVNAEKPKPKQTLSNINSKTSLYPSYKELKELEQKPLKVLPFNVAFGGKFVIWLLQKYQAEKVLILVRVKVLARELCLELKENGFSCTEVSSQADKDYVNERLSEDGIVVASYQDTSIWESHSQADLVIMVQPPLESLPVTSMFLRHLNIESSKGMAVMLYNQNDLEFIKQIQKYVDVIKINPPSFYSVQHSNSTNVQLDPSSVTVPALPKSEPLSDLEKPIPAKIPQYALYRPAVPVPRSVSERTRLNDRARLYVRGGSGGQGSPTYAGLGGDGGHVILQCQEGASLQHFVLKENRRLIASHGEHFAKEKRKKKGRRGLDLVVPVPPGITVSTDDGHVVGQLNSVGSRLVVAQGGEGGNPSREGWCGEKGTPLMINLDLKLIADVGLIGFPNAGKSTLLGELSRATVKTGDFPFTTIRPSIGMLEFPDLFQVSIADLPGLVEGAHYNRGMGHKFLKHVERTKVLALVVDINGFQLSEKHPQRTAFQSLCLLVKELYSYDNSLAYRPKILLLSKMDTDDADIKYNEFMDELKSLNERGLFNVLQEIPPDVHLQEIAKKQKPRDLTTDSIKFEQVIPLSSISGQGLEEVRQRLRDMIAW
ncbi:GTP-binding protein 10-like isoform X3 [Actinia tenebrosa]|uniref:GTP-binding protein 10-like isoform X1 n=1 Tax=Actinia tenebrosa TaxID=6105 RepID=A0A6P8IB80_ACTTE|nr:GTP-binding protein 10-like isoform X1 [Actinia tenebrosa]XP_031562649.1 GTP-binding protein 10-like isoform X2 [Actinia tenebrosa]XP_031562650.1 GTP-binding protein 10-like isoform X3 [Actinia tenebrosa]